MKINLFNSIFFMMVLSMMFSCAKEADLSEKFEEVATEDLMQSRETDERDCTATMSNILAFDNNWTIYVREGICSVDHNSPVVEVLTFSAVNINGDINFGLKHDRHYLMTAILTPNTPMTFDISHDDGPTTHVTIDHFFNTYSFKSDCGLRWVHDCPGGL